MDIIIKNKKNILLFILLFVITFIFSYMFIPVWPDQVWSYGFSYNISKGMIIYRDFNVIQMPLYFLLASIFIKIFGSYMIISHMFDSLLLSVIGLILFKLLKWKGIFPFIMICILTVSSYNLLCLNLLIIIIYLIHTKRDNDYIIALLIGLILITKQNIGIMLFIPMIYYSKNKIKSIILFIIPFILLCLYLLINNALFSFIDYCFLGLFEFSGNNEIDYIILFIEFICIGYLIYKLFKCKFKDKELFYILMFQIVLYPLIDLKHFVVGFIPIFYYLLLNNKKRIINIIVCIFVLLYLLITFIFNFNRIDIHTKKDMFYLKSPSKVINYLENIHDLYPDDINNYYFDSEKSYLFKLYYDIPIKYYDFYLNGNMGYYSKKDIKKSFIKYCKKNRCIFFINKDSNNIQFSEFRKIIKSNYKKIGEYEELDIYSSK